MKVSQLCEESGVSVPSIKFYLREGLLPAGERVSATQAEYGPEHVERLRLIRALIDVGGLPVATAHRVLEAIDSPDLPLSYVFGVAQYAISDTSLYADAPEASNGVAQVDALIEQMGWVVSHENPGRRGAARVLDTYAELGQQHIGEHLADYAEAAEVIARADLASVAHHTDVADMAETVVVGTVLGDALNASLRRIAQEHVSYQMFPAPRGAETTGSES
ncbi:MAG: MerR family transcriptional regulator [Rhodoglobus sp.]